LDLQPSLWVKRWSHLVPDGGRVLDVACGSGRHVRWFTHRGAQVTAVDRDAPAVVPLRALPGPPVEVIVADIENGAWPLLDRRFDAVVVTNYLWRPLFPTLLASVDEGGVLIYETFAVGNETVGRPSKPDFLLQRRELLAATTGLRLVAYEEGFLDTPERFVQRVVAVREPNADAGPRRYPLLARAPAPVKSIDSEEPA